MTDPDKPAFDVVDRRHAAQTGEPDLSHAPDTQDDPADTEQASTAPPQSASPNTTEDANPAERGMPDPAALLGFVTMQMDVRTLIDSLMPIFDNLAWRSLGLVANPMTGQTEKDLPAAQLAIDTFQFLLGKLEGSFSAEEKREAQRRLNDLRMNYLSKMREN